MIRGSVLALAVLFNLPTLWQALADQTVSVDSALIHVLITVPVVAVLMAALRAATRRPRRARRRPPARTTPEDA